MSLKPQKKKYTKLKGKRHYRIALTAAPLQEKREEKERKRKGIGETHKSISRVLHSRERKQKKVSPEKKNSKDVKKKRENKIVNIL